MKAVIKNIKDAQRMRQWSDLDNKKPLDSARSSNTLIEPIRLPRKLHNRDTRADRWVNSLPIHLREHPSNAFKLEQFRKDQEQRREAS